VVGYLKSNDLAFRNIERMLRPGGYVIFTVGKAWSVSRACRSAIRICKNVIRLTFGRRNPSPLGTAKPSLFRCYNLSEIKCSFPPAWKVISVINLAFGSGILGRTSVAASRFLERLFLRRDPLRLALTSFVITTNHPKK
jgi:hypothetical protein